MGFVMLDTAAASLRYGGENYRITGNTFAFSAVSLLNCEQTDIPQPAIFDGNTYAPLPGIPVAHILVDPWGPVLAQRDTEAYIRDELCDQNAIIVTFE